MTLAWADEGVILAGGIALDREVERFKLRRKTEYPALFRRAFRSV